MTKQTTTVERPWLGDKFIIPKVDEGVLYVCIEEDCGAVITSESTADFCRGTYTKKVRCPECEIVMHKVIK